MLTERNVFKKKIIIDVKNSENKSLILNSDGFYQLSKQPVYLEVQLIRKNNNFLNLTFQNCEEGNFPLQPHNRSIKVYVKNNHKYVKIKRIQFPLNLGYSFTLYKVQSSTINKGTWILKNPIYLLMMIQQPMFIYQDLEN